jgi:hypothetical protein
MSQGFKVSKVAKVLPRLDGFIFETPKLLKP